MSLHVRRENVCLYASNAFSHRFEQKTERFPIFHFSSSLHHRQMVMALSYAMLAKYASFSQPYARSASGVASSYGTAMACSGVARAKPVWVMESPTGEYGESFRLRPPRPQRGLSPPFL